MKCNISRHLKVRQIFFILATVCCASDHSFGGNLDVFTAGAHQFMSKYVQNGSVDYKRIKQNIQEAEQLYTQLGEASLTGVQEKSKRSFYINAYNIVVIYWVARHYPLKSPLDQSGFFDKVKHKVAGEEMTLNTLEIKKLLDAYNDARIHFALACAAKSCPPLASFAFTPEMVDEQLNERTTAALNDKGWVRVDHGQKKVGLSKIFDWYKNDFNADKNQFLIGSINTVKRRFQLHTP
ncbi:MAG: DUF547 domain-containing protein [Cyclobacteriaceae bacterium]|nr:DUF547 domain-containing protein [Cyclobacteriaceae bacterium]